MLKKILTYGAIAGVIVGTPLFLMTVTLKAPLPHPWGMVIGYLTMLIALSAVFIAVKRHRDVELGGVIKFWPALGLGLGISVVAGLFYVFAWEVAQMVADVDYIGDMARMELERMRADGAAADKLSAYAAEMEAFKASYANPLIRLPLTFVEIFSVGVLVSLITAALLRNSRFLPARA
ncbi:DUF4199 domain-containing protein [Asticcacaulis sp. AC402]|uniref:DUF4199 domain-containing protein n=1 Tax=Asticcacaulis sp. AC402 TaxID=1282361 RepID=UPI0003C3C0A6|nr:DUF4199 domain-containing protein [Asticcacaulis sp. AC402]ESQ76012.1 hypothetical protein ABAC402_06090 [Asticcacaulis sp. AC402]